MPNQINRSGDVGPIADGEDCDMSTLAMTPAERESFLAEPRVGILAIARPDDAAPLAAPIWYAYEGGDVLMIVGSDSQKARLLTGAATSSLCVSSEELPYRFVTVGGPTTLEPVEDELRRRIAARYLPAEMVDGYLAYSSGEASLTVRLTPTSWYSNDFNKLTMT
jgi:nitroimidazol reductase NimA-like FMN-containing flavoprotein (pyridoxamine 5'-phosphate oxidase superfamily)